MNKKSKVALKNIVKECLIEILAEGLVGNNQATLRESRELRGTLQEAHENIGSRNISQRNLEGAKHVSESRQPTQRRRSYLDSITTGIDKTKSSNTTSQIQDKIKNVTDDPVMQDIFADTAATTLREQKEGARPSGPAISAQGDQAAKIVDQSMPEEIFGDSASKWASLAFAPSIRK
tara:strand:- start:1467 stop:1997 length:531 start_codon:yes stop_codon:yes gene_type:complete